MFEMMRTRFLVCPTPSPGTYADCFLSSSLMLSGQAFSLFTCGWWLPLRYFYSSVCLFFISLVFRAAAPDLVPGNDIPAERMYLILEAVQSCSPMFTRHHSLVASLLIYELFPEAQQNHKKSQHTALAMTQNSHVPCWWTRRFVHERLCYGYVLPLLFLLDSYNVACRMSCAFPLPTTCVAWGCWLVVAIKKFRMAENWIGEATVWLVMCFF